MEHIHSSGTFCDKQRAVVVAQLVEWSLPIPEICSSNPVIGNIIYNLLKYCNEKTKNKEKEAGNGPIFEYKGPNEKIK